MGAHLSSGMARSLDAQRGAGQRLRQARRGRAGVAILTVTLAVSAACGSRTSTDDLRALLDDRPQAGAAPAVDPTSDAAPEPSPTPAGTPDVPVAEAPGSPSGRAASEGPAPTPSKAPAASIGAGSGKAQPAAPRAANTPPAPGQAATRGGTRSNDAATGPAPTPAAPRACSGSEPPIVIGTIGIRSGPLGDMFAGGVRAVETWVGATNAKGGLHCHQIKLLTADDGNDPARHKALVRRFVEQDKVIAFVYNPATLTGHTSADYLNEKRVPVIGQEGGQLFYSDSPVHFSAGSDGLLVQRVLVAAAARVFVPAGIKKIATLVCTEADYCITADRTFSEVAPALGLEVVYRAKASLVQPDFTSHCLEARNAGATAFITGTDPQSNYRLAASCAKLGYKPRLAVASLESDAGFKDDPNLDGAVVAMNNLPWVLPDHPAVAEYLTALKKYKPGTPAEAADMNGWAAAKAFERALRDVGPGAVTGEDVLKGMYTFVNEDLGGLSYPLTYTPETKEHVACGWVVLTGKGKFTSDGKMFCIEGYEP